MKYRKKPAVIEAVQWFPGVAHPGVFQSDSSVNLYIPPSYYVVTAHDQPVWLEPGDWILPEPDGMHYYPCKPDIFEATYEPIA